MFDAFVFAAGHGTRLMPLTRDLPKPLVPVCGVPILDWTLAALAAAGHRSVLINAHHAAEALVAWAAQPHPVEVRVLVEDTLLGTAGGLAHARPWLAPRALVLNGDVLHTIDLARVRDAIPRGGLSLALHRVPDKAASYGVVAADSSGTVVRLRAYTGPPPVPPVDETTVFTGVWGFDRTILDGLPVAFGDIVEAVWKGLFAEGRLRAVTTSGPWLDIGNPEGWWQANLVALSGKHPFALDPFTRAGFGRRTDGSTVGDPALVDGVHLRGPVWVGAGARIAPGATLDHAIVGPGAQVGPHTLRQAVVWAGGQLGGDLHHGALGPEGVQLGPYSSGQIAGVDIPA